MKIVFLDIDEVLNTFDDVASGNPDLVIERDSINLVNLLVSNIAEVRFVFSSSWRQLPYDFIINRKLLAAGFQGKMHDNWRTPMQDIVCRGKHPIPAPTRGDEIYTWMLDNNFGGSDDKYVIFDDDDNFYPDQNLIKTNPFAGLSIENIEQALQTLCGSAVRCTTAKA